MSQTQPTLIPFDRLPLGFRFRPTDEELINNYLKLKINGRIKPSDAAAVAEVDVCRLEPWDLPARSAIRSDDQEWFFFAPVDRKYPSGNRSNRATEAGYWKATGRDRFIRSRTRDGPGVVGMKKTLVFHRGRAPRGERTHWIMHEYRTVEREFEEGGFVLCRLFRKPEERVSGTITPEPEESGFSPILTKFYPINTFHIDDFVEGEYAAPLNEKSPESNMHEESQPLRGTINNQLIESMQADKAYYLIPYPNKSEESHSNDNMATDERAQMAERKDPALYDELLGFLGPEYKDLFSDEFPGINVISADLEEDSVHDFLESILSVPANETGSTTMVASGSLRAVHEGSSSRDVDSGVLVEERGRDEVYFQSLQTSDRHNEIRRTMETVGTVKRKSRKLASPIESGTLPSHSTTTHAEDSLEKLSSSTDFIRHQGTAERRIKLESLKSREKKLRRRSQVTKLSDTRDPLGMVTDEVAKNSKNKTTEIEVPEPAFFVPYERSSDDGFSSDIQLALSLPEHEKPRSRSRPRHRRRSVCDSKMEGSSLHETKSRVWSIPTRRIGAAVLAIASLICAGAVWYFNS